MQKQNRKNSRPRVSVKIDVVRRIARGSGLGPASGPTNGELRITGLTELRNDVRNGRICRNGVNPDTHREDT